MEIHPDAAAIAVLAVAATDLKCFLYDLFYISGFET
jgi:hypothetical protein